MPLRRFDRFPDRLLVVLLLLLLAPSAPAAKPRPPAPDASRGSMGVSIFLEGGWATEPQLVYFIRAEGRDGSLEGAEILTSTLAENGRAYLLNAEPGRYTVVGFARRVRNGDAESLASTPDQRGQTAIRVEPETDEVVYFEGDAARRLEIEVPAGDFAFAGRLRLRQIRVEARRLDDVQRHYAYALEAARVRDDKPLLSAAALELDRGPKAARAFWRATEKTLRDSAGWSALARRQLEALETAGPTP